MPFNGSGTFSIVNTFVPNTTILSAAVNQNFSDIATGLSNCLTRDGQAGMTAAFKAVSGSLGAPGISFNSDATAGLYLSTTGIVGLVAKSLGILINSSIYQVSSAAVQAGGSGYAVGDTITLVNRAAAEPLPGFKEVQPQVFAGLFPVESNQYDALRDSLEKLKLNDAALMYEPEVSQALGFGFRCGFLGLLHMEIVQERLEREFDQDLITTAPSVVYQVLRGDGEVAPVAREHGVAGAVADADRMVGAPAPALAPAPSTCGDCCGAVEGVATAPVAFPPVA